MTTTHTSESRVPETGPVADSYDVVVMGAGPAGSSTATLLAQHGHSVLLLERDIFPRFKIGESLIPATLGVLERLGMVDTLKQSAFPQKHSVQFYSGSGKAGRPFYFHETEAPEESRTWQVLRSEMDTMLFDNARRHGVEAFQGADVKDVLFSNAGQHTGSQDAVDGAKAVGVRVKLDGETRDIGAKVVVDATGQRALLSRRLKLRTTDPNLRQASIFTHFHGALRDPGIDEGATLILQTASKKSWFWFIPLPYNTASVGVVGGIDHLIKGRVGTPQEIFDQELAACPGLIPRLNGARQLMPAQVLNEFSYMTRQGAGDGWVMAGDAFGFLDPMYSTGVLLALRSGEMVADTVHQALTEHDVSGERLGAFSPRLRAGMSAFRKLVYAFYHPDFSFGKFLGEYPEHHLAVVKILVGDVFDRDFSALYRDLAKMVTLPDEGAQVQPVESAAAGG